MDRIVAAGGFVNQVGRVNGNLNLSRAIGDLKYKQSRHLSRPEQVYSNLVRPYSPKIISGDPDVSITQIAPDDKFFIMACDGVWDCFSNQEAVNFVLQRLEQGMELLKIVEEVLIFFFLVFTPTFRFSTFAFQSILVILVALEEIT
jgi:serine/threonine protein phosphatase PrpC